jgi:hypothetical protein
MFLAIYLALKKRPVDFDCVNINRNYLFTCSYVCTEFQTRNKVFLKEYSENVNPSFHGYRPEQDLDTVQFVLVKGLMEALVFYLKFFWHIVI